MISRRLIFALLLVVSWGLTIVVNRTGPMEAIERRALDARFETRRALGVPVPVDPSIELVLIDDAARAADPDPPQLWFPKFIRMAAALTKAGARVVGIDFMPTIPARETLDADSLEALLTIAEANRAASETGRGGVVAITAYSYDAEGNTHVVLPRGADQEYARGIIGDDSFGLANLTRDQDGIYRSQRLLAIPLKVDGEPEASMWQFFAPLVAQRALGQRIAKASGRRLRLEDVGGPGGRDVPTFSEDNRYKYLLINYAESASANGKMGEPFAHMGWADLWKLRDKPDELRARFKDKIVLIGPGSSLDNDLVETPVRDANARFFSFGGGQSFLHWPWHDPYEGAVDEEAALTGRPVLEAPPFSMLGIEAHAHVVNTLTTGSFIYRVRDWANELGMLSLCLATALAVRQLPTPMALLAVVGLMASWMGISLALFVRGTWIDAAGAVPAVVITAGIFGVERFVEMRRLFGRYVSDAVAEELLSDEKHEVLGATSRQEVTVLFSDINGFSTACESDAPDRIVAHLNEYFRAMVGVIDRHGGWLKQFVGDEIMAVYGVPRVLQDAPRAAVESALEMVDVLAAARRTGREGFHDVKIGIHTGEVIVGNVGSETRAERAVIGDDVNLGSRIMGLAGRMGVTILVSEATYARVTNMPGVSFIDRGEHEVKGRARKVRVYEVCRAEG